MGDSDVILYTIVTAVMLYRYTMLKNHNAVNLSIRLQTDLCGIIHHPQYKVCE